MIRYLFPLILQTFNLILLSFSPNNDYLFKFTEIVFLFFYFHLLISSFKKNSFLSLYSFFLLTSSFFLFNRIFLDIFSYKDYLHLVFPAVYDITKETASYVIFVFTIVYSLIDFGYYRKNYLLRIREPCIPELYSKLLFLLLIILYPLVLYRHYLIFRFVQQVGYIQFTFLKSELPIPAYLSHVGGIFYLLFFSLLLTKPEKKIVNISLIMYLIQALGNSIKGSRSAFGYSLIFVIFFYFKYNNKKFKFRYITYIFILFILFYFISSLNRGNNDVSKESSIFNLIFLILYEQGISISIPFIHIQNFVNFFNPFEIPYLISDYLRSIVGLDIRAAVDLSEFIAPGARARGFGLGYSFINEIIDLGLLGLVASYFFGKIIKFIDTNFFRVFYLIPFFSVCFMYCVYAPRHFLLYFLAPECVTWYLLPIFAYIIIKMLFKYIRRQR